MSDLLYLPESSDESDTPEETSTLRRFRCPVCEYYMVPPIQQCSTGHDYCHECYKELRHCPSCLSPKVDIRNYSLEKLYYKIKLPCKNVQNGCPYTGRFKYRNKHQVICKYTLNQCPFVHSCFCSWVGVVYNLLEHCQSMHHYYFSTTPVIKKYLLHFDQLHHGLSFFMIFAHDCMFRLSLLIDLYSGWLKFAVYYIHKDNDSQDYSYEMKFLKHGKDSTAIALKGDCIYLTDFTRPFVDDKYLFMPVNVLQPFCDNFGDLHYIVTIIPHRY